MPKMVELRARAECAVRATRSDASAFAGRDVQGLIHDFQVQEVALEMQNESLERVERDLEKSRELYEDLYDFAPVGYLTLDAHGSVVRVNAAALSMLAAAPANLLDRPLATFVVQADLRLLEAHLQETKLDPRPKTVDELRLSRPDGSALVVRLDTSPAPSGACEFFVVMTDISERKRADDALVRLNQDLEARVAARTLELASRNQQLEREIQVRICSQEHERELEARLRDAERMRSLGVLAGGIAHDYNNLLVSVLGNADLMLHSGSLPKDLRESVKLIERAALNASDLTRQLLVYAGEGRATMAPVHLPSVIKESVELVRCTSPSGIDIHVQMSGELPLVDADRGQVQQIVLNLVRNGIDAMGEHGTLSIRAGTRSIDAAALTKFSHARTAVPGAYVVFQVQDTGGGINDADLTRIFDPFFTTKFAGRGLGLASVLGIVQSHHGALRVRSTQGEGTSFEIALPEAGVCGVSELPPESSEPDWRGSGPVLVIDDDDGVRRVLVRLLESLGFDVSAAGSGETGLAMFGAADPAFELVVLDWTMPGLSGQQVLQSLRAQNEELAVILVSGFRANTLAMGDPRVARVQKPMTIASLSHAVRSISPAMRSLSPLSHQAGAAETRYLAG